MLRTTVRHRFAAVLVIGAVASAGVAPCPAGPSDGAPRGIRDAASRDARRRPRRASDSTSNDPAVQGGATGDLTLAVTSGADCTDPSGVIVVTLDVSNLSAAINGVQALIHYDTTLLALQSVVTESPWSEVVTNDVAGDVSYGAIIPGGSIQNDHTIAALTFTAVTLGTTNVAFQPDNPPFFTKLTVAADNSTILPAKFDSGTIFIGLPDCTITADGSVCADSGGHAASVPDAGAGAAYAWTVTGGTLSTGDGTNAISYTAGQGTQMTLDVTVTDANGCTATCQHVVTIDPNPVATAADDGPVCDGDAVSLFGGPDAMASYVWTGPGFSSSEQNPTRSPAVAGTYTVSVTDANGCTGSATTVVAVNPNPVCTITADASVCPRTANHVASVPDAGPDALYVWQITGGTIDSQTAETIQYTAGDGPDVDLSVTITDGNGCLSTCQRSIPVTSTSISVTVELEAASTLSPQNPVTRDVTFVITDCIGTADTRVQPVAVDEFGIGSAVLADVSLDAAWISAREGHTLRRVAPVTFDGCANAAVDFTGPNRLLAGDLQTPTEPQDNFVDITDFSILAAAWGTAVDPNASTGADVTGDGVQDTADFTAIQVNYFDLGDAVDGCPAAALGRRTLARAQRRKAAALGRIPVHRLRIPNARRADLTGDGVVDETDIRAFARRYDLPLVPAFRRKLERIRADRRRGRLDR